MREWRPDDSIGEGLRKHFLCDLCVALAYSAIRKPTNPKLRK